MAEDMIVILSLDIEWVILGVNLRLLDSMLNLVQHRPRVQTSGSATVLGLRMLLLLLLLLELLLFPNGSIDEARRALMLADVAWATLRDVLEGCTTCGLTVHVGSHRSIA